MPLSTIFQLYRGTTLYIYYTCFRGTSEHVNEVILSLKAKEKCSSYINHIQ